MHRSKVFCGFGSHKHPNRCAAACACDADRDEYTLLPLQELVKEGLIKGIGLSEISAADIRKAHAVYPITAVEMEWSLFTRDAEVCSLSRSFF